jgi:hypothetical protein
MHNYLKEYNINLTPVFERSLITESHTGVTITLPILINGEDKGGFIEFKGEEAEDILKRIQSDGVCRVGFGFTQEDFLK